MREQTARLVLPVFRRGLLLKERLRHGQLDMAHEQAELTKLVRAAEAAGPRTNPVDAGEPFLGVGYPLACWLDESFILDPASPWRTAWNEKKLEQSLHGRNERAWLFWEQARLAQLRADADVLEVFYLCVVLGFRGNQRDDANALRAWRQTTETLLGQGRQGDWPDKPPELPLPPPAVAPRHARERLLWVLLGYALLGGAAILAAVLALFSR